MLIFLSDPITLAWDWISVSSPETMSKHKTLAREEIEILQVLSHASGNKVILFILNGLHLQTQPQSDHSLGILSSLIKDSVCSGVQQGLDLVSLNILCKVRKSYF